LNNYLSILGPADADGTLTLNFETIDASTTTSFNVIVSVDEDDSEKVIARKINTAVNTYLNNNTDPETGLSRAYSGCPSFSSAIGHPASFRCTRTEHVLAIYSQCNWLLTVEQEDVECYPRVKPDPGLLTIESLQEAAALMRVDLTDDSGEDLTNSLLSSMIMICSSELCRMLRKKIVASTILHEETGKGGKSLIGEVRPGLSWDTPKHKRPFLQATSLFTDQNTEGLLNQGRGAWNFVQQESRLDYKYSDSPFDIGDPNDSGVETKWTYIAGHYTIPDVVATAMGTLVSLLTDDDSIGSIAVGSFKADPIAFNQAIVPLQYFLSKI
jgi:hypothetical protein